MGKMAACFGSKIYAIKKQYPIVGEFGKRMNTVKMELNRDPREKKSAGKNVCKNRQKP